MKPSAQKQSPANGKPSPAVKSVKSLTGVKWEKLEDQSLLEWEDGQTREFAEYLGFTPPTKEGFSGKHAFKTVEGQRVETWGSKILDSRLQAYPVGQPIKVQYAGKAKGKNGTTFKNWNVFGAK